MTHPRRPNAYWLATWGVVAPLVMAVIFLFYVYQFEPVKYGKIEYPSWAHIIGTYSTQQYCGSGTIFTGSVSW